MQTNVHEMIFMSLGMGTKRISLHRWVYNCSSNPEVINISPQLNTYAGVSIQVSEYIQPSLNFFFILLSLHEENEVEIAVYIKNR